MIALASDHLLFQMADGQNVALCPESIPADLFPNAAGPFDPEFVGHAANAVFHYFKHDLDRQTVSAVEFAGALQKVLRGFHQPPPAFPPGAFSPRTADCDLDSLALESGSGCELLFFPRLRDELRHRLRQNPRLVRFRGLRPCVLRLLGARRWTPRCQTFADQIVHYLRQCLKAEASQTELALVVE